MILEETIFRVFLLISYGIAIIVFIVLFFINAPYGRHTSKGWGPMISNRLGWLIMEAPSPLLMLFFFVLGEAPKTLPSIVFLLMWWAHYLHRAFIYPFTIADGRKKMPVSVAWLALVFNLGNGYLNGFYLFSLSGGYTLRWLWDIRFLVGFVIFVTGFVINRWADEVLRRLRMGGDMGYKIPYGGLYEWISCPNYFGEIIEWIGWAIATWSLAGLSFATWTFVNLAPRAYAHHRWYYDSFPDYPQKRRALIPKIW
jgi:hypothetical protein